MKTTTTLYCSLLALACAGGALAQGLPALTPGASLGDVTLTTLEGDGRFQRFAIEADGDYRVEGGDAATPPQVLVEGRLDAARHLELRRSLAALRVGSQASTPITPFTRWHALEVDGPASLGGFVSGQLGRFADPHLEAALRDLEQLSAALLAQAGPGAGGLAAALAQPRTIEGTIQHVGERTHVHTASGVVQVAGAELNALARRFPGLSLRIRVREIPNQPASLPWTLEVVELPSVRSASYHGTYQIHPMEPRARVVRLTDRVLLQGPLVPALDGRDVRVETWQLLDEAGVPTGRHLLKGFAAELTQSAPLPGSEFVGGQLGVGAQLLAVAVEGDRVRLTHRLHHFELTVPKAKVRFHGMPGFQLP